MHGIKTATLQRLAAVATLYFQKGRKKKKKKMLIKINFGKNSFRLLRAVDDRQGRAAREATAALVLRESRVRSLFAHAGTGSSSD